MRKNDQVERHDLAPYFQHASDSPMPGVEHQTKKLDHRIGPPEDIYPLQEVKWVFPQNIFHKPPS